MKRLMTLCAGLFVLAGAAAWLAYGASAATRPVAVQDNLFADSVSSSGTTTITVGDTVEWTWGGSNPHTVFSTTAESFDSGTPQTSGTFSHTFNAVGTYAYICGVHGNSMAGTVVVQAAAATATNSPQPSNTTAAQATNTPAAQATSAGTVSTSTPVAATASPVPGASATPPPPGATAAAPTQAPAGAPASAVQVPRTGTGAGGSASAGDGWLWVVAAAMGGIGGMVLVQGRRRREL